MGTERISSERCGHVTTERIPCRWCGKMPEPPRRTFCSDACIHEHKLRTQPSYQAKHVLERDHGICCICGVDCEAWLRDLIAAVGYPPPHRWYEATPTAWLVMMAARGIPKRFALLNRRFWEVDHSIPVSEGGGDCGLENLRTLCWRCHQDETSALAARRAARNKSDHDCCNHRM